MEARGARRSSDMESCDFDYGLEADEFFRRTAKRTCAPTGNIVCQATYWPTWWAGPTAPVNFTALPLRCETRPSTDPFPIPGPVPGGIAQKACGNRRGWGLGPNISGKFKTLSPEHLGRSFAARAITRCLRRRRLQFVVQHRQRIDRRRVAPQHERPEGPQRATLLDGVHFHGRRNRPPGHRIPQRLRQPSVFDPELSSTRGVGAVGL